MRMDNFTTTTDFMVHNDNITYIAGTSNSYTLTSATASIN